MVFAKLSLHCGFIFVDDKICVVRRRLPDKLHFGHSRIMEITPDAKIFRWMEIRKDIQQKVKKFTICLSTGVNPKYQVTQKSVREIKIFN